MGKFTLAGEDVKVAYEDKVTRLGHGAKVA